MTYKNLFFFILGPIILGVILANLTWFVSYPIAPWSIARGLPFPFFDDVVECVLPPGATDCPGGSFSWIGYILDLLFWSIIMLAIVQSIKFFTRRKLRK